jgi:hypothetical protein
MIGKVILHKDHDQSKGPRIKVRRSVNLDVSLQSLDILFHDALETLLEVGLFVDDEIIEELG